MRKGLFFLAFLVLMGSSVFADDDQMKITLVKIVHQLEAIKPLIHQAEQEQSQNPRMKIHFEEWISSEGERHNGLRQDIENIQQALIEAINAKEADPRIVPPIKGDFVGQGHV